MRNLLHLSRLGFVRHHFNYIPIESFKSIEASENFNFDVHKVFYSSGTTTRNQEIAIRSISPFSKEGLEAYKQNAISQIIDIFSHLNFSPNNSLLVSWIPTTDDWPNSSLAQMIKWFSEKWPSIYLKPGEVPNLRSSKPLWIFATALDYYTACNQNPIQIADSSLLFETGGTKTSQYLFHKNELYRKISYFFGVSPKRIVSEYGMAELASQAYELESPTTGERYFSYYNNKVKIQVQTNIGEISNRGIGTLIIDDPARIDLDKPIKTQDIIYVYDNNRFKILGRTPNNLIKGCSLLSESQKLDSKSLPAEKTSIFNHSIDINLTLNKAAILNRTLESIFRDQTYLNALSNEIGSKSAVKNLLYSTIGLMPSSEQAWLKSAKTSAGQEKLSKNWLLIPPSNHSYAVIYPIVIAYLLNLNLHIRIPNRFSSRFSALRVFINIFCKRTGYNINLLTGSFDLFNNHKRFYDAILVFGDDLTINKISEVKVPSVCFGAHTQHYFSKDLKLDSKTIMLNAFNLGQLGCLNTKLIITHSKPSNIEIENLANSFNEFWQNEHSNTQKIAIYTEEERYRKLGFDIPKHQNGILLPHKDITGLENIQQFESECPFVLPILYCQNPTANQTRNCTPANTEWDGTHLGQPLFAAYNTH